MLIGVVRVMLPSNQAAFRIWQNQQENLPTLAFGHQQVYYVTTKYVDQLKIEKKDFKGIKNTWNKIKDFLEYHKNRTVVGYIGYEIIYKNSNSNFPLVHLVVPINVEKFNLSTKYEDLIFPKINLCQYDDKNKAQYLQSIKKVINWIGEDKKRKLTIARKISLPSIDLWKSFLQDPSQEYNHFSFYYGIDNLEFVGHSPEMTMYRSAGSKIIICEKASGTFPQGNKKEFAKDKKNLYEHNLSINSLLSKINKVAYIKDTSRKINTFPNLQHFVTSIRLKPKKSTIEIIKTLFPKGVNPDCGIKLINKLEDFSRGPYYGLFFAKLNNGEMQVYHILRSLFREENNYHTICGAGITYNSNPQEELRETELKLSSIIARA